MLALNVTIYGLGIVFLALLVLMFSIMVLTKLFSLATGKEMFTVAAPVQQEPVPAVQMAGGAVAAPTASAPAGPAFAVAEAAPPPTAEVAEQVFAPLPGKVLSVAVKPGDRVRSGDELCVIEAMKMGNSIKAQQDGVVGEVLVSPGQTVAFGALLVVIVREGTTGQVPRPVAAPAPAAAAPAAAAAAAALAAFKMGIAGKQHQVDLKTAANGPAVVIDGVSYKVERDKADAKKVIVNGTAHTVEVKDRSAGSAFVVVDGVAQKVEISGEVYEAPPRSFTITIAGKQYQVEVNGSTVKVDGATYQVERDKADAQRFLVNGQPHTVEVREIAGEVATVVVDGAAQRIELSGLSPAAAPAASLSAPATAPAPAPAAAPASAPAAPSAPAAGETVTAPLPGKILSVAVNVGDAVKQGDELCVIEAMKMGNSIKAQRAGTIKDVLVSPGQTVGFGAPLVVMG